MCQTLCLIPARRGSKRIPRKNVRRLAGKPLVQYSIQQARAASLVDHTLVTTDDDEVASLASTLGVEVHLRPRELASDTAKSIDVVCYVLEQLAQHGRWFDYLVLLQPTTPYRDPAKIDEAIRTLRDTNCDSAISVIRVDYFHPNRMKKIDEGRLVPYGEAEIEHVPRTQLPEAYYRDGAIYATRTELVLKSRTLIGADSRPVVNDGRLFVNIDTERDWVVAEYLAEAYFSQRFAA